MSIYLYKLNINLISLIIVDGMLSYGWCNTFPWSNIHTKVENVTRWYIAVDGRTNYSSDTLIPPRNFKVANLQHRIQVYFMTAMSLLCSLIVADQVELQIKYFTPIFPVVWKFELVTWKWNRWYLILNLAPVQNLLIISKG